MSTVADNRARDAEEARQELEKAEMELKEAMTAARTAKQKINYAGSDMTCMWKFGDNYLGGLADINLLRWSHGLKLYDCLVNIQDKGRPGGQERPILVWWQLRGRQGQQQKLDNAESAIAFLASQCPERHEAQQEAIKAENFAQEKDNNVAEKRKKVEAAQSLSEQAEAKKAAAAAALEKVRKRMGETEATSEQ